MVLSSRRSVMKRYVVKALKDILFVLIIAFSIAACEKDAKEFGTQIMQPEDRITAKYDSSFQVKTFVEKSDSFQTLYPIVQQRGNLLLGDYFDPHFGKLEAGFMLEIFPTDTIDFDAIDIIGAKLYLRLAETYGPPGDALINVYKLNQNLDYQSKYYSSTNPESFYNKEDKISLFTEYQEDTLIEITLTKQFAEFLKAAPDSAMTSSDKFLEYFPGIYAEMESFGESGYLSDIKITNDSSYLELSYTQTENGSQDTLTLDYQFGSSSLRVNTFEHNFEEATHGTANVYDFLTNDSTESDSILFTNSLGGVRTRLELPEKKLKETFGSDTFFLARAEIEIKPLMKYQNADDKLFPDAIRMYTYLNDTSYISISNSEFFNGRYLAEENIYSCNITNYLQDFIDGYLDEKNIYLQIPDYRNEPGQLIFSGAGHNQPIKLRIKYYKP